MRWPGQIPGCLGILRDEVMRDDQASDERKGDVDSSS